MDQIKKYIKNDDAIINIDLMFAIILLLSITAAAILIMPTLSHEDRDWRIEQYTTATRATDNLVQDTGEPGWEANWSSGNYSKIITIGLLYVDDNNDSKQKILSKIKIDTLMGNGYIDDNTTTRWWEFPNSTFSIEERQTAAKALGLEKYNFYMQLHPVGLDLFNSIPLEKNFSDIRGINYDTASVIDRYVYIVDPSISDNIKYLKYDNEAIHYRLNLWVW